MQQSMHQPHNQPTPNDVPSKIEQAKQEEHSANHQFKFSIKEINRFCYVGRWGHKDEEFLELIPDLIYTKMIISHDLIRDVPAGALKPWRTEPHHPMLEALMYCNGNHKTCLEMSLWLWSHLPPHHYQSATNHHPQTH